jgi:hypothetical protein
VKSYAQARRDSAFEVMAADLGTEASLRLAARRGRVHSVYGRAVNVIFPEGVVSVVDGTLGRGPLNITLAAREFDFLGLVREGSDVLAVGGHVELGSSLRIGLGSARRYCTPANFSRPALGAEGVRDNISIAKKVILDTGRLEGLGALLGPSAAHPESMDHSVTFVPWARGAVLALARGLSRGDVRGSLLASEGLIGLGVGLTPSGDDLLSGAIFALIQGSRNGVGRLSGLHELASGIARSSIDRTTLLSQSYLQLACRGSANEVAYDFVEGLYAGTAEELKRALGRLLKRGATSGTDIATGATLGAAMAIGEEVMSG